MCNSIEITKSEELVNAEAEVREYARKINTFCEQENIPFVCEPISTDIHMSRMISRVKMEVTWGIG